MEVDATPQPEILREVNITEDGGVIKKVFKEGEGEEYPQKGDSVQVHYTGRLLDGTVFDSSVERNQPFEFKLGKGKVIKGWDLGVETMKKGEKAVLVCRGDYAYGKAGSPPKIPGDATLLFDVELLSWKSKDDLSGDGGILRKIIKKADKDKSPSQGQEVLLHYVGRFPDGKVFDSTRERGTPFSFRLRKDDQVPEFFHKVVEKMSLGEQVEVKVKAQYGFGEKGNPSLGVPPGSDLVYEIELISIFKIEELIPGVSMKVLKESSEYKKPQDGSKVEVEISARMKGSSEVFLSFNQSQRYTLGSGDLPEAVDLALLKMAKGEEVKLEVHDSDFFYGEEENKKRGIPIGKMDFEIHLTLVSFEKGKESWEMKAEEKMERSKEIKEKGNEFFKVGRSRQAEGKYKKALDVLSSDYDFKEEEKKAAKEIKLSLYLNLAALYLKAKDYSQVISNCDKALEIDRESAKALYRRGQARKERGEYEEAKKDIKKGMEKNPEDKDFKLLLSSVNQAIKVQDQKDKKIYANLFQKLSSEEQREAKKVKDI